MIAEFRPKIPLILIALLLLFLLGFYRLADPLLLPHDGVLNSADMFGAAVCHRLPTHSFSVYGRTLPLCARCSGIYLGVMIVLLFVLIFRRERHAQFPSLKTLLGWGLLIIIMAADGINSLLHSLNVFHLYEPRNWLRLFTGMGAGLTIGLIAVIVFAQVSWRHPIPQTPIATRRETITVLLVAIFVTLLVLSNQPTLLYVLGIVSAVSIVVIISLLYMVLAQLLLRRDGRAQAWWHLLPLGICMLVLTSIQMIAMATWRLNVTGTLTGF